MEDVVSHQDWSIAAKIYMASMVEVKQRIAAIDRVLGAKKPRTLDENFDNEFCWLQIRRIVELVAFSAIAPDLDRYSALRASNNSSRVEDDAKATKIMRNLEGINPGFMPVPTGPLGVRPDGIKQIEGLEPSQQATRDRLSDLFNESSEHIHAANPFSLDARMQIGERKRKSRLRIVEVRDYLRTALWQHYKLGLEFKPGSDPKAPDEWRGVYLIDMGSPGSPKITMTMAIREPDQDLGNKPSLARLNDDASSPSSSRE